MADDLEIVDTFFSLRAYCPADAEAVRRIWRLSHDPEEIERLIQIEEDEAVMTRVVIDRIRFGVVGTLCHAPIGARRLNIFSLAVHPEFRRFGYGHYLMCHARIDAAQHHERAVLQCVIDQRNVEAARFLKAHHFKGKIWQDDYLKFEFSIR